MATKDGKKPAEESAEQKTEASKDDSVEMEKAESPKADEEKEAEAKPAEKPKADEGKAAERKPTTAEETGGAVPNSLASQSSTPPPKKSLLARLGLKKSPPPKPGSTEAISQELYQQITQATAHEYWTLRVKKKSALVIAGILIILLWLSSLGRLLLSQRQITRSEEVEPTPTAEVTEEGYKVRVRYNREENASAAAELAAFLLDQPEVGFTDTAPDFESDYDGVSVVTKSGDFETRRNILILVESQYATSSIAAQLTEDSNIDASVFFNP